MAKEPEDDFDIVLNRLRVEQSVVGRQIEDLKQKESGIFDAIQAVEKTAAQVRRQREVEQKQRDAEPKTGTVTGHSSLGQQISDVESGKVVRQ